MPETAKWYVIHTYSGYENKVMANIEKLVENRGLQDLIFDIRVPMEDVVETENNVTKIVKRKVFPGYVIIKMIITDESWYAVRNTRGVTGFVGPESKPVALTEEEITRMGIEKPAVEEFEYELNSVVKIDFGPMAGSTGVIDKIDNEHKKVTVLVSMFGRETPVELDFNQISAID